MQVYHALSYGAGIEALRRVPPGTFSVLVSAWNWVVEPTRMKRAEPLLRELPASLMVDSGAWGALRKRKRDFLHEQDLVFEIAERLGAQRVAALDVPMVPELLEIAGLSPAQALETTLRNAERAAYAGIKGLGLTIQGRNVDERGECFRGMKPFLGAAAWFGVGGVAKCSPDQLEEHISWVRERISGHLHGFGVGSPARVRAVRKLGLNSVDSSTAAQEARFNRVHWGMEVTQAPRRQKRDRLSNQLLLLLNARNLDLAISSETDSHNCHVNVRPNQLRLPI